MKEKYTRLLAFFVITCLLCSLFALPTAAADATVEDVLGEIENEVPGITDFAVSLLAINSLDAANAFLDNYSIGILLITALVALVMAFFGYRALRFAILLGSFAAGWILGSALYSWVLGAGLLDALMPIPSFVPFLVYTICGFLASFLAMRIIRVGIFLAATAATYFFLGGLPVLNTMIDKLITEELEYKYVIVRLIIALIVGALSLALTRPVLIITTGAAGGMVASISLMVAIEQTSNINLEMAVGIILAAIGIIVQFSTGRRKRRARRR